MALIRYVDHGMCRMNSRIKWTATIFMNSNNNRTTNKKKCIKITKVRIKYGQSDALYGFSTQHNKFVVSSFIRRQHEQMDLSPSLYLYRSHSHSKRRIVDSLECARLQITNVISNANARALTNKTRLMVVNTMINPK